MPDPGLWIFSAGDLVALAAAGVAGLAIFFNRRNTKETLRQSRELADAERGHALRLAREDREQARLKELYDEVATITIRAEWTVNRTMPIFEPSREPPPPVPEEKLMELNGRIAIHGTDEMLSALDEFRTAQEQFYAKVYEREAYLKGASERRRHDDKAIELWREVDERRDTVRAAARAIEEVARRDLRPRG
jgi:hypothetical protein